jgi:thiosulfate/3-mercaptopyruvate sulfurtransferase
MLAEAEDVIGRGVDEALVDARAPERYSGAAEPIDTKAGHIPGAVNLYWQGNLDASLRFLSHEALRSRYEALDRGGVIMYCGSGVTSCLNVLAMEEAGLDMPRLYIGSWSDWISYEDNPVATGSETG